jgi:toxin-antitoxin system PIN domain toxin
MISFDTNILFPSLEPTHVNHEAAKGFLMGFRNEKVAICELVLMEVYQLVRNPSLCRSPLNAVEGLALIQRLRTHPQWSLIDYPGNLMGEVWKITGEAHFPRRRLFDVRLALTLRHHGVKLFATVNTKDFQDIGFERVWNPLEEG